MSAAVECLRCNNSKLDAENIELRKELECLSARNAELCCNISKAEEKLKGLEASLFCTSKDNECARAIRCDLTAQQQEKMKEKDALTSHVAVLTAQNGDLSRELSHFVEQDEVLRAQLDRRSRVECLEKKNASEQVASHSRVMEARDRSPVKAAEFPAYCQGKLRGCSRSPIKYC